MALIKLCVIVHKRKDGLVAGDGTQSLLSTVRCDPVSVDTKGVAYQEKQLLMIVMLRAHYVGRRMKA